MSTRVLLIGLVLGTTAVLLPAAEPLHWERPGQSASVGALPQQMANSARLRTTATSMVDLAVSIRRSTMRCDELEAHVELNEGSGKAESYQCFGPTRATAITELVLGQGSDAPRLFRIDFEYLASENAVAYTIRQMVGTGAIAAQRVVVDLAQAAVTP